MIDRIGLAREDFVVATFARDNVVNKRMVVSFLASVGDEVQDGSCRALQA